MPDSDETEAVWSYNPFAPLASREHAQDLLRHAVDYTAWAVIATYATAIWLGVQYDGIGIEMIAIMGVAFLMQVILVYVLGRSGRLWSVGLLAGLTVASGAFGAYSTFKDYGLGKVERYICAAPDAFMVLTALWLFRCFIFLMRKGGRLSIAKPSNAGSNEE